jgi:hypothetical protein
LSRLWRDNCPGSRYSVPVFAADVVPPARREMLALDLGCDAADDARPQLGILLQLGDHLAQEFAAVA